MVRYCGFAAGNPRQAPYHDREYGFPIADQSWLFERLLQEIIRTRLKVNAAIENAWVIQGLRDDLAHALESAR